MILAPPFGKEQLEELKRKDLVALCKEYEIKCVGKNSELIGKLLELRASSKEIDGIEQTPASSAAASTCEANVQNAEAEVQVEAMINEETKEDRSCDAIQNNVTGEESKGEAILGIRSNETVVVEAFTNNTTCNSNGHNVNVSEAKSAELPIQLVLQSAVQPAVEAIKATERRQSARLSGIHKDFIKMGLKSTAKSSSPKAPSSTSLKQEALSTSQKENLTPKPSNIPIKSVPTCKASMPQKADPRASVKRPISCTSAATKRPKFDLKESLQKKPSYKPYSGPVPKLL